jgi:hypothetical protein
MKYEVISGPVAIDATTIAQNGEVVELSEADAKALVQYQIVKPVPDEPVIEPAETAAQKKKRLADEAEAETAKTAAKPATTPPAA